MYNCRSTAVLLSPGAPVHSWSVSLCPSSLDHYQQRRTDARSTFNGNPVGQRGLFSENGVYKKLKVFSNT